MDGYGIFAIHKLGNPLVNETRNKTDAQFMRTYTAYTADGNYAISSTDARKHTVLTETDPDRGLVYSVTDPAGQTVEYAYDAANRVTSVETITDKKVYCNDYTYDKDRLATVSHNTTTNLPDVFYSFETDALGNQTKVKVGTQTLSENHYSETGDKMLECVEYGNGGKVSYTYDGFKRTTGICYDSAIEPRFTYEYGANGAVGRVKDAELDCEARMAYDLAERPVEVELHESGEFLHRLMQEYDRFEQPSKMNERIQEEGTQSEFSVAAAYDKESKPIALICKSDDSTRKLVYTYDELGRIAKRDFFAENETPLFESQYTYMLGGYGANSTTPLIRVIEEAGSRHEYWYDIVGNIVKERWQGRAAAGGTLSFGGQTPTSPNGETLSLDETSMSACYDTSYTYDVLGQLTRVNDQREQATWIYHYDKGGNIQEKKRYKYTTDDLSSLTPEETISYAYDDMNWKDKLTAYSGKPITYDEIGNPLTYDGWVYTWKAGRMLHSMINSSKGVDAQFTYDHTGLRVKKNVNGVETRYIMNGKKITYMRKGNTRMHFFYDAQGRAAIVRYNDVDYAYLHNLQGDVTGIVDMTGALVVQYAYDAWGKPLGTTGSMAQTLGYDNPFRYRGYAYDEETGLYYLRSRYYDPVWQRFLNADTLLDSGTGLFAHNVFAYCRNNPSNCIDPNGKSPQSLAALITAIAATAKRVAARMALARNGKTGYVHSSGGPVNLRTAPSESSSRPQKKGLANGERITYYDSVWNEDEDRYWLRIQKGKEIWIAAEYVYGGTSKRSPKTCTICDDDMVVREIKRGEYTYERYYDNADRGRGMETITIPDYARRYVCLYDYNETTLSLKNSHPAFRVR